MEIQRIMNEYYDQLCNCKSDNPDKMDQFLERHNLPKLKHKEINALNRLMSAKKVNQ